MITDAVARGREVAGFTRDAEGVAVRVAGSGEIRTRSPVGRDGAHSSVRKQAGIVHPMPAPGSARRGPHPPGCRAASGRP